MTRHPQVLTIPPIALADLATAVRNGLVESDAEGGRMMALTCGRAEGIWTSDPLHTIHGTPELALLLFSVCAGRGEITAVRPEPLLSLAIP